MIRDGIELVAQSGRLPRMRGDDPGLTATQLDSQWFAPHARG